MARRNKGITEKTITYRIHDGQTMSKSIFLREAITARLTAAAEEIFGTVEKIITEYQEEITRSKEENERLRRMLDIAIKPVVKLHRAEPQLITSPLGGEDVKEEQSLRTSQQQPRELESDFIDSSTCARPDGDQNQSHLHQTLTEKNRKRDHLPTNTAGDMEMNPHGDPQLFTHSVCEEEAEPDQEWSPSLEQENLEPPHIKEEHDLWTSQEQQHMQSDQDPHLHQSRTDENREKDALPTNTAGDIRMYPDRASPTDTTVLTAMSGLSRQITLFAADVNQQLTAVNQQLTTVNTRLLSLEERMPAELNGDPSVQELKRKRRAQNPKISEVVRRFHNSEANSRRYNPEKGLSSPHNEAVTAHLVEALAASPYLHSVNNNVILTACKTYYETVRRNFRYSQPDLAGQAEAIRSSARSRQRRKRLLEARQSVLAAEETDLWRGVTLDLMSDEEDCTSEGEYSWIVRPPSFRSQELSDLCATLQARLEANAKYMATRHRRLHVGAHSDRSPPNMALYDPEAAKRHLKAHWMPQVQL